MKQIFKVIFVGLFSLFCFFISHTFANEGGFTIQNYRSNITLNTGGEFTVRERIIVHFSESRHGIYRDIPFRYKGNNGKKLTTQIYDVQVRGYKYSTEKIGNIFRIKIGSPDVTVEGEQVYDISYKVYGGVRGFHGYQEVYRNMLGTQRPVSINNFSFTFSLPTDLSLQDNEYYAVWGKYGEKKSVELIKSGNEISGKTMLNLNAYEGVTLAIKLPEKYTSINIWRTCIRYFEDYGYFLLFLVPFSMIINFYNIRKKTPGTIKYRDIIYYTPPKGYTPGQVACIYAKGETDKTFFATIYSWATDGYIKIIQDKDQDNFILEKIKEKKNKSKSENYLRNHLFPGGRRQINLKKDNFKYSRISVVGSKVYECIKYILFTEESVNLSFNGSRIWLNMFVLFLLANKIYPYFFSDFSVFLFGFFGSFIFSVLFVSILFFQINSKKFSEEGVLLYEQVLGYKKYLEKVEEPKLQQLIKDDPQYFEKVLPFAVALGMETKWIKKCGASLQEVDYHPTWIQGGENTIQQRSRSSNKIDIGSQLTNAMKGFGESSAFSIPTSSGGGYSGGSSSSSSSSGGGGGGGFSGGGGGGGGGGSW